MKCRTRLRLWWNRLWIRKDEFHSSLSLDIDAYSDMTSEEQGKYMTDLGRRRSRAHEADLVREDKERAAKTAAVKR